MFVLNKNEEKKYKKVDDEFCLKAEKRIKKRFRKDSLIILIIMFFISFLVSNFANAENIEALQKTKKCVFNTENLTFQKFGVGGVFYRVGDDLLDFNETIKNQYNLGFSQGSIVNIQMPPDFTNTEISTTDDKIQYYKLCYFLEKIK